MNNYGGEGNFYTIRHVVLATGLSDRTIRNYIASGFLEGELINGVWHFTPEQVEKFISDPAVRPSILAKNNAIIYDFLSENKKTDHESCIILDLPDDSPRKVSEFFCRAICEGDYKNIRFSFDSVGAVPRVILKGYTKDIIGLVSSYYSQRS